MSDPDDGMFKNSCMPSCGTSLGVGGGIGGGEWSSVWFTLHSLSLSLSHVVDQGASIPSKRMRSL